MTAEEMIKRVQAGAYGAQDLLELYKNCLHKDVPELLDAIYTQLWQQHPAHARKRFGAKGEKARQTLEALVTELAARHDLRANQVGSHVKVGGLARRDAGYFLDLYISYKRKDGEGVSLSYLQQDVRARPMIKVTRYKAGKDATGHSTEHAVEAWPEAARQYETLLSELLVQP